MRARSLVFFTIFSLYFLIESPTVFSKDKPKISKSAARRTVISALPHGKIVSSELETEGGALIWSFDVRDGSDMKEVWVDANTGAITHNEVETKAAEEKEKKMDKAEAMVKHKTGGTVTGSSTEGSGSSEIYVFQVKKKNGEMETVRVNAHSMKIVK